MRKVIIIAFLFYVTTFYAQVDLRKDRHIFIYDIELNQVDFDGTAISPANKEVLESGWKFRIRNIVGTDYIILVSKFTSGNAFAISQNLKTYQDGSKKYIYFKISKTDYEAFAEEYKKTGSFVVGASSTLIKIRPGNGKEADSTKIYSEFGNDFNIGLTAGFRFTNWKKQMSVSFVGGISFSSIKVTPQTTRDFVELESTQASITFSTGLIFEMQKVQLSVFLGIDTMSGEIGRNWIYRNRPWIGLGFGYEIFKPKTELDN